MVTRVCDVRRVDDSVSGGASAINITIDGTNHCRWDAPSAVLDGG